MRTWGNWFTIDILTLLIDWLILTAFQHIDDYSLPSHSGIVFIICSYLHFCGIVWCWFFSSLNILIQPIDGIVIGITTLGQSVPGSNGYEWAFHIPTYTELEPDHWMSFNVVPKDPIFVKSQRFARDIVFLAALAERLLADKFQTKLLHSLSTLTKSNHYLAERFLHDARIYFRITMIIIYKVNVFIFIALSFSKTHAYSIYWNQYFFLKERKNVPLKK